MSAVNVPGFQIWPQTFQEGHPLNDYYTHLTLDATVKKRKEKKGQIYFKNAWQRGRVSQHLDPVFIIFFNCETILYFLVDPSFISYQTYQNHVDGSFPK